MVTTTSPNTSSQPPVIPAAPLLEHVGSLITDTVSVQLQLVEDQGKTGKVIVRGEFGKADRATENKRVYPRKLLEREFRRLEQALERRQVFGELDHPTDGRTSLNRTSHIITGLRLNEDNTVYGEAEALDTERGRNLQALLRANCKVGVSSRGYGSTKPNELGEEVVQDDYKLVTYDFVAEPADTKALPDVFFEENQNMGDTAKEVETKIEEARAQERARCKEEFSKELVSAIGKVKTDVYEQVKTEMLADPSVAAAKGALDQIKDLVRPYVIPEDANELVKVKDSEIAKLRNVVAERDLKIAELEGEIDKLAETAREVGYKYFLEQQIANDPEAEVIRKLVGDVKSYKKAEDIKIKIEAIKTEMAKKREEAEAIESRIREEVEKASKESELLAQRAAMEAEEQRKKAEKLQEALERAVHSEKELALRLYAEKKMVHHPQAAKLRSLMESAHPQSKSEIDGIISSLKEPERAPEDLEKVRARVRKLTKGGIGPSAQDEEAPAPGSKSVIAENYNGLGVSLGDLKRLIK